MNDGQHGVPERRDGAWAGAGYGNWLRATHRAAEPPADCVTHGLRKAAGRLLAEAGASTKQIMAILGPRSLNLAELYTRDAEQEHLAASGMTTWEGRGERIAHMRKGRSGNRLPRTLTRISPNQSLSRCQI